MHIFTRQCRFKVMRTSKPWFLFGLKRYALLLKMQFFVGCLFLGTFLSYGTCKYYLSRFVGKSTICIGENKGADQLRGNREADQRLCFRYSDSTIPLLLNSKISSF